MGECFFWYRPTRVVPDQRPLNGRCCCCSVQLQFCSFLPRDAMLARYMLSSCPSIRVSVRPSVTSRYCVETTGRIEPVFGMGASFHQSHSTSCYKKIWVSSKIRVLWDFVPNSGLFATASRSRCQQNSSSSSSTVEFVDNTYTTIDESWLFYKSINCNPLTPLLRFVVDVLYNLFLQLTRL